MGFGGRCSGRAREVSAETWSSVSPFIIGYLAVLLSTTRISIDGSCGGWSVTRLNGCSTTWATFVASLKVSFCSYGSLVDSTGNLVVGAVATPLESSGSSYSNLAFSYGSITIFRHRVVSVSSPSPNCRSDRRLGLSFGRPMAAV